MYPTIIKDRPASLRSSLRTARGTREERSGVEPYINCIQRSLIIVDINTIQQFLITVNINCIQRSLIIVDINTIQQFLIIVNINCIQRSLIIVDINSI